MKNNHLPKVCLYILITIFLTACSSTTLQRVNPLVNQNLILFTHNMVDELIENAMPPIMPGTNSEPILITTFVDNNNLSKTNQLGLLIQNQSASRFVQQTYKVQEIKMGKELTIDKKNGETILTRDKSELDKEFGAQAIMVGTISRANNTLYITARLVSPIDKTIISSGDYQLDIDKQIMSLMDLKYKDENNDEISEPQQPYLNSIFN